MGRRPMAGERQGTMLFHGTFEYAMDQTGRVPMPPLYRVDLREGVYLTPGTPDHCIRCFSAANFEQQAQLYLAEPNTHRVGRIMRRQFFGSAFSDKLDQQGRVLIPLTLRQYAKLS